MPEPRIQWIADPQTLATRLAQLPAHVGLDTEFIRERTYWPQLALVQLAIDDDILLIDPLVPGMTDVLRPLLLDPAVLKVMHSAGEDLIAFKHACDAVPTPLFDTQVAAAMAGIAAGLGYQKLVQEITGEVLAKGETRSDWMRRPLSDSQLAYAADDVRHLAALHQHLDDRLAALGRRAWLDADCARQVRLADSDETERWPHLSLRAAQHLDPAAQHRLLRLLRWREQFARERDRPRSWVLDNELATLLARDPPADAAELQRVLDRHPKSPRKLATQIQHALQTPLSDESDAPPPRTEEVDRKALKRLQDAVAARSAELGLPDGVLASRRWLEALLERGEWPQALSGWRRAELEPVLAPLLGDVLPAAGRSV
ncbi:ribonuclease D [Luteimonas sp. MHLX1A]|uniref:ribonuclease D n=1 Tax=Alterluteimonas muca TaxID=2878684 RepID=UPI001E4FA6BC|nr:ribonuclease D [Luteimonas sp. MHLX1A]MCD9046579.1 ribonuclease D [Luteimonas sp. MHLX1A]